MLNNYKSRCGLPKTRARPWDVPTTITPASVWRNETTWVSNNMMSKSNKQTTQVIRKYYISSIIHLCGRVSSSKELCVNHGSSLCRVYAQTSKPYRVPSRFQTHQWHVFRKSSNSRQLFSLLSTLLLVCHPTTKACPSHRVGLRFILMPAKVTPEELNSHQIYCVWIHCNLMGYPDEIP